MARIDTLFLLLAALCLIVGVCLGIYMGMNQDFQLVPVHAHLNLVGWVSLALFGVVYRLYPRLAASRLARVQFWLAAPSAPLFPVGIYLAVFEDMPLLVQIASLLWLASALVFFAAIAGLAFSRSPSAEALAART
jgi:hypothetical protein